MEKRWWHSSVVYQIYPRSFMDTNHDGIGDLRGITQKLDYLKELGVEIIWLSPVYQSPNDDNGYDISDYRNIMTAFGTMTDFEEMVAGMHSRGLKLVMDLVVNHTSDEHPWFEASRASKNNPFRDYYYWRPGRNGQPPAPWQSAFGGPAWTLDERTGEYYLHLFSRKQPDLNWQNPAVRDEVYDLMRFWLQKGVDGFRMDVINAIDKKEYLPSYSAYLEGAPVAPQFHPNGNAVHGYLQEMRREALSGFDTVTVGECPEVTPQIAHLYVDADRGELDMVFHFEHMDIDWVPNTNPWQRRPFSLTKLKEIFSQWQKAFEEKGWNSLYWNNHDQPRVVSRFGDDQSYRVTSAKMLATLLHMLRGTPYIYQGEELGMTNVAFDDISQYRDIATLNTYREHLLQDGSNSAELMQAIHARSRDNARTPMQWDNSPNAGFSDVEPWIGVNKRYPEINARQAMGDQDSVFYYYQKLIALRKQYAVIVYGNYTLLDTGDLPLYAYLRQLEEQTLIVICNFSRDNVRWELPLSTQGATCLIANYPQDNTPGKTLTLKPYEAIVYLVRDRI